VLVIALLLSLLLAACGGGDDDNGGGGGGGAGGGGGGGGQAETGEVTVVAKEFAFSGVPASLPSGETTFTLQNEGKEQHQFILVPLREGAPPVEELIKVPQKEAQQFFAGPPSQTFAKPGETGKPLNTELKPGTYGYVCFVTSKKEKKPHAFLGMFGSLEVEG
jgi:hypothetical protein